MIGLLVIASAFVVAILPQRWGAAAACAVLAGAAAAHVMAPLSVPIGGEFFGFAFSFSHYRPEARFVGGMLAAFGAIALLYVWPHQPGRWFAAAALIHSGATLALITVADLLSFFVFWELITLGAIILIYQDQTRFSVLRRYFIYQMAGAAALLFGIAVNYGATGGVSLSNISAGHAFFLLAVAIKTAAIPLHLWLTETYPAVRRETVVVLSAYATKAGVIGAALLLPGFGLEVAGGVVALVAVLYALKQRGLREFLSFHIISQVGYMTAGVASIVPLAVNGGYYHLVNHVIYKGLLFMVAGSLIDCFGHNDMYQIQGAGRRKPLLMLAAIVGSASIAGLPPFSGFISKSLLKQALAGTPAAWLLIAASVGTALSFTKFLYLCFFVSKAEPESAVDRAATIAPPARTPLVQWLAMGLLSGACVVLGVAPQLVLQQVFQTGAEFYYGAGILSGVWPALLAAALFMTASAHIIQLLRTALPQSTGVLRIIHRAAITAVAQLRILHNGNLLRYISWAVGGLIMVWAVLLLL